jgi:hypothetical protein
MSLCLVISIAAAKGLVNSRPNREEEEEKEAQYKEREKYGEYNSPNKFDDLRAQFTIRYNLNEEKKKKKLKEE